MAEWLRNGEYNKSFRLRNRFDIEKDLILSELYATAHAFQELGVREGMPVANIPKVEEWHHGEPRPRVGNLRFSPLITLEGSVGSGKTYLTLEHERSIRFPFRPFKFVPDGIYLLKDDVKHLEKEDLMKYHAYVEVASHLAIFTEPRWGSRYTIATIKERGDLDQLAFRRAHLLTGSLREDYSSKRLEAAEYFLAGAYKLPERIAGNLIMEFIINQAMPYGLNEPSNFVSTETLMIHPDIVVMFLVRPDVMARRRGKHYSHTRMRLWWELYRQHVRMHHEIISGKINIPHYFCFNAETPLEENVGKFNGVMADIEGLLSRQPKLPGPNWLEIRGQKVPMQGVFKQLEW